MQIRLGAISPTGWLRRQLEIQAEGLSGHLDEFWPDVRDSGWIGGDAEGWERAPYWLDGLVPLAFLLDDDRLVAKVDRWLGYILEHQRTDGWLGPETQEQQGRHSERDPWPVFIMIKVLMQYAEARHEDTPGERSYEAIVRALRAIGTHLDRRPLRDWNQYRWGDLLVAVLWCRERRPEPRLDELAERAHNQGYDWTTHFARFPFTGRSDRWTYDRHVVNNAMGVKSVGLWKLLTTGRVEADDVLGPMRALDEHHGQATGMFSGDECLAGLMPSQGTELCAVVEYLYSLELLLAHQPDVRISDRLELVAYNALPAPFSPDMWAHQYDQQVNQAQCVVAKDHPYTTNDGDANIYGLEPHFGCCTANMHQGFPKLAAALWVRTPDGGLRALTYAPCEVAADASPGGLGLRVGGGYPFSETVTIAVSASRPGTEVPLELPVPAWAEGATFSVDGARAEPVRAGSIVRLVRAWTGEHRIVLRLPMRVRVDFRYNRAASVYHGPILYALQPDEAWTQVAGEPPHADWEVRPTSPWNVAIALCEGDGSYGLAAEVDRATGGPRAPQPVGADQADPDPTETDSARVPALTAMTASPVRIPVTARVCADWAIEHGAAAAPPPSPVEPTGDEVRLDLVPYGSTGLRIAEIPWYWTGPNSPLARGHRLV